MMRTPLIVPAIFPRQGWKKRQEVEDGEGYYSSQEFFHVSGGKSDKKWRTGKVPHPGSFSTSVVRKVRTQKTSNPGGGGWKRGNFLGTLSEEVRVKLETTCHSGGFNSHVWHELGGMSLGLWENSRKSTVIKVDVGFRYIT